MKRSLLAAALISAALISLAGCAKKTEVKNSELIINNGSEPQSLDPSKIEGVPEHRLYMALFQGLVSYNAKDCSPEPGLAESWERTGDGTTIVFHLRKSTWSDGTPITAQTFVDSWLYYMAPSTAANYAYMPAAIIKGAEEYTAGKADASTVGLKAIDEDTLEVQLVGQVPYAENMMAHYSFSPLPLHAMKAYGSDWTKPENFVGNGPFILETWKPQEIITVIPNDKFWNKENVFISRLSFLPIENQSTAYNKFKSGEIDWSTDVPTELLDEIKLRDDYQLAANLGSYYYEINHNDPVLKDVRVRKALAMAINREELCSMVTKGGELPTDAFVPPMGNFVPAKGNGYNVEKAKELLAEAGYPEGKGFPRITVIYNTMEKHKKIAEYIQQQWKTNLGIDLVLENLEWATFLDKRQSNDFQIARAGWLGDYADPSNFLELCLKDSGNNDGRYNNPEFDKLVKQAARMSSGSERDAVLMQAEEIMMTQDQNFIPLYFYVTQNLIDLSRWDGWYQNILDIHPYVGIKPKK